MINSAIYNGKVIHKRFKPKVHSFKYSVFSLFIDLSELETLDKEISFFSLNKFNLISFFEKDHGDRDGSSLTGWVIKQLQNYEINTENIKIKLLCYPRIFGYVFNPLSVFYIYDKNENIIAILYEVKNTFGEQHTYVFKVKDDQKLLQHNCSKKFHVSPFIEMTCSYFFRLLKPGQKISVIIDQYQEQDNYRKLMILYNISDKIVFSLLRNIDYGHLEIKTPSNTLLNFGDPQSKLKADMTIKNPAFNYNLIKGGSIAFAECYMRDEFETSNLSNLIELTARNIKIVHKFSGVFDFPLFNYIKNKIIKNTKGRSKENIAKHYDLGNEFFSLWLDNTLTYSSAIFDEQNKDLSSAQNNKYQKLINLMKPNHGDKVLEIGCGWGGFAEYLGKNYDVKLDCITISKKQFEYAKERIQKCGLNEKVNIEIKDYRDLKGKYNSIASIEMIEAVGQNYLQSYFNTIKHNLSDGGKAAIQAITIDDSLYGRYKNKQDFIQKYIFPGGFLPSKNSLEKYASDNGLFFNGYNSYAEDYSNTLAIWRDKFNEKWEQIKEQGFDSTFKRMWEFYLSYCEAGFKSRNIDLIQFSLQNK